MQRQRDFQETHFGGELNAFSPLQGVTHAHLRLTVTAGQQGKENTNPWLPEGKHLWPKGGWLPSGLVPNCHVSVGEGEGCALLSFPTSSCANLGTATTAVQTQSHGPVSFAPLTEVVFQSPQTDFPSVLP